MNNGHQIIRQLKALLKKPADLILKPVSIKAVLFDRLIKYKDCEIFNISLYDIKEALKLKEIINPQDRFLKKYHKFLLLFDRVLINRLPPHHPNINLKIKLLFEIKPPFYFLYDILWNELKVINQTLKDLLIKDFIHAFKSLIIAFILFIKKPDRSLKFYVNY